MIWLAVLAALVGGYLVGFGVGFLSGLAPRETEWTGRQS